jgi:hypothetical protein
MLMNITLKELAQYGWYKAKQIICSRRLESSL